MAAEADSLEFLVFDEDFVEAVAHYEFAVELNLKLRRRALAATQQAELAHALRRFGYLEDAAAAFTAAARLLDEVRCCF